MANTSVEIRRFDPFTDTESLRQWWELGHQTMAERALPQDAWPAWEVTSVSMTQPNPERELIHLIASVDGQPAGFALLILWRHDNPHLTAIDLGVTPQLRRRGVGAALLDEAERLAGENGRNTFLIEVYRRPGAVVPGEGFLRDRGYTLANLEAEKSVELVEFQARREALEAYAAERLAGYRILTYGGACPEEYLESYCAMVSTFMSEIPLGDLAIEDSDVTPDRHRAVEARREAIGQEWVSALALSPDGEVVGASDLRFFRATPQLAGIGITMVVDGHRGHRLGLALKLATHGRLADEFPQCERVITGNAAANTFMNSVNEQLGYVTHEELLEMQKKV